MRPSKSSGSLISFRTADSEEDYEESELLGGSSPRSSRPLTPSRIAAPFKYIDDCAEDDEGSADSFLHDDKVGPQTLTQQPHTYETPGPPPSFHETPGRPDDSALHSGFRRTRSRRPSRFRARRRQGRIPSLLEIAEILLEHAKRCCHSVAAIPRSNRSTSLFVVGTVVANIVILISLLTVIEVNLVALPSPIQWYAGGDANLRSIATRGAIALRLHRLQRMREPHDRIVATPTSSSDGDGVFTSGGGLNDDNAMLLCDPLKNHTNASSGSAESALLVSNAMKRCEYSFVSLYSKDVVHAPAHRRRLVSPSGRYVAQLQASGNLVVLDTQQSVHGAAGSGLHVLRGSKLGWAHNAYGSSHRNGNDDTVLGGSTVLWASGRMATQNGCPCRLVVRPSAEVSIIDVMNETVWRAHSLYAHLPAQLPWLTYVLAMRNDGNLALSWGVRGSLTLSAPAWTSGRPTGRLGRNQIKAETRRVVDCFQRRRKQRWVKETPTLIARSASHPAFPMAVAASEIASEVDGLSVGEKVLSGSFANGDAFAATMASLAVKTSWASSWISSSRSFTSDEANSAASSTAAAFFHNVPSAQRILDLGHADAYSTAALLSLIPAKCEKQGLKSLVVDISAGDAGFAAMLALKRGCQVHSYDAVVRRAQMKQLSACFNGWNAPEAALHKPDMQSSTFVDAVVSGVDEFRPLHAQHGSGGSTFSAPRPGDVLSSTRIHIVEELTRLCDGKRGIHLLRLAGDDVNAVITMLDNVARAPMFHRGNVRNILIELPWAPILNRTQTLTRLTQTLTRAIQKSNDTSTGKGLALRIARMNGGVVSSGGGGGRETRSRSAAKRNAESGGADNEAVVVKVERQSALATLAAEWTKEQVRKTKLILISPSDLAHIASNMALNQLLADELGRTLVLSLGHTTPL